MIRGTIYYITADPCPLHAMDESDFYDRVDALEVDYVQNDSAETAAQEIARLRTNLEKAGFGLVLPNGNGEWPGDIEVDACAPPAFGFVTDSRDALDTARINWFARDLAELKAKVAALTPREFACDTAAAARIVELTSDTCGDAVYLDMGTGPALYTVPVFMRNLEPGRTYYVAANTVTMH